MGVLPWSCALIAAPDIRKHNRACAAKWRKSLPRATIIVTYHGPLHGSHSCRGREIVRMREQFSAISLAIVMGVGASAQDKAFAQLSGTHYGDTSNCTFSGVENNANRMTCKFMPVSPSRNLRIEYVSGQCISTQNGSFLVKQFEIATNPNGRGTVMYQLPLNKSMLSGGFVNGSYTFSATQTSIYANAGTPLFALIDLALPFGGPYGSLAVTQNIGQCTVSLSGVLFTNQ